MSGVSGPACGRLGLKLASTWVPASLNSGRTSNSYQCKAPENNYLTLSRCLPLQNYYHYTPFLPPLQDTKKPCCPQGFLHNIILFVESQFRIPGSMFHELFGLEPNTRFHNSFFGCCRRMNKIEHADLSFIGKAI